MEASAKSHEASEGLGRLKRLSIMVYSSSGGVAYRSFTTLAERVSFVALSAILQEYFNEMADAVFATDGILDKYIGDSAMAFWCALIE